MKSICLILLVLVSFLYSMDDSKVNSWIEDIAFFEQMLEAKHIDLYHKISKSDFQSRLSEIKKNLSHSTEFQIITKLMKLASDVGDSHTSIPLWETKRHLFPLELFDFSGELRVIKTEARYQHLLGKKLIKINGTEIIDVYNIIAEISPFVENDYSKMQRSVNYLMVSEILVAYGFIDSEERALFTFLDDEGNEQEAQIESVRKTEYDQLVFNSLSVREPEVVQPTDAKNTNLWFTQVNNTVYIKFRRYPSYSEMEAFGETVLNHIRTHEVQNLIIDLRDNYGGDFFVGLTLARYLNLADSIDWKSGVYVLTDRVTFSAAMSNAVQFRQILNAQIVGEPTGANPVGYQDMGEFKLPNSGLFVTYSKRMFRFQETDTKGVQPDIVILPKWEHVQAGRDEVLSWVLNKLRK